MNGIKNFEEVNKLLNIEANKLLNNEAELKQLLDEVYKKELAPGLSLPQESYDRYKTLIDSYFTARRTGSKVIERYEQKKAKSYYERKKVNPYGPDEWEEVEYYCIRKYVTYRVGTADSCVCTFPDNAVQNGRHDWVDQGDNLVEGFCETVEDDWVNSDSCEFSILGNGNCEERMRACAEMLWRAKEAGSLAEGEWLKEVLAYAEDLDA